MCKLRKDLLHTGISSERREISVVTTARHHQWAHKDPQVVLCQREAFWHHYGALHTSHCDKESACTASKSAETFWSVGCQLGFTLLSLHRSSWGCLHRGQLDAKGVSLKPPRMLSTPVEAPLRQVKRGSLARVHMHQRRNVVVYTLPRPTVGVSSNEERSARGIGSSDVGEKKKKGIKEYNSKCEMSSGESCALSSLRRFANSGVLRHQGTRNSQANSRSVVVVFTSFCQVFFCCCCSSKQEY